MGDSLISGPSWERRGSETAGPLRFQAVHPGGGNLGQRAKDVTTTSGHDPSMGYGGPTPRRQGGPGQRTSRDAFLHREVRWRLFKMEEMPARLRRLERLERAAEQPPEALARAALPAENQP